MSIAQTLGGMALGQVLGESADLVVKTLADRFTDHGQRLMQALRTAIDRAWKTLELALAGDSFWDKLLGKLPGERVGPHSDVYGFGKSCYFAHFGISDPDDRQKATMPPAWRRFFADCTAQPTNRLADFVEVLKRLKPLKWDKRSLLAKKAVGRQRRSHPTPRPTNYSSACPHCQKAITLSSEYLGRPVRCPQCSGLFTIHQPLVGAPR